MKKLFIYFTLFFSLILINKISSISAIENGGVYHNGTYYAPGNAYQYFTESNSSFKERLEREDKEKEEKERGW